jgi:hypothetical protein
MAGYYEVNSWHVSTLLDLSSAAEPGQLPPVMIEVAALDQATDIGDLSSATPRTVRSSREAFIQQLKSASGFEAERIFRFEDAEEAVSSLFDAVMTDSFSGQLAAIFWDEVRIPVFGSAPQDWVKLADLVHRLSPDAAIVVVGVGVFHIPALTLVLAIAGTTVAVRVLPKVMTELGEGLAAETRNVFRRSR